MLPRYITLCYTSLTLTGVISRGGLGIEGLLVTPRKHRLRGMCRSVGTHGLPCTGIERRMGPLIMTSLALPLPLDGMATPAAMVSHPLKGFYSVLRKKV